MHKKYYAKPCIEWITTAKEVEKNIKSFGNKVEKFTNGVVKTNVIFWDNVLEPFLIISIEIIDKGIKKKIRKEIETFIGMIKEDGISLRRIAYAGNDLEKFFEEYKSVTVLIKNTILEITTPPEKENKGT
ncbi:MAG: hypothetical protein V1804_02165 [Patescibacteria group bacterium]